jgi:hypothetical protein
MKTLLRSVIGSGIVAAVALGASSAMAFPWDFGGGHDHGPGKGPTSVPEINSHGAAAGAAIVLGGAAVILSSRKRRRRS